MVTRVGVYVIAAVLLTLTLAMSLLLLAFWKTRKRVVNVVPILPTGRDDDNWERASFERIVDGEKRYVQGFAKRVRVAQMRSFPYVHCFNLPKLGLPKLSYARHFGCKNRVPQCSCVLYLSGIEMA